MNLTFKRDWLEDLAINQNARSKFNRQILRAYRDRITQIIDATDERDLRAIKDAHFEKLKGDLAGKYSMRLHGGWRVIFEIHPGTPKITIHVIDIDDYH